MRIHNPKTHEEIRDLNIQKLYYNLREEAQGMDMSFTQSEGHEYDTYTHLIAGMDAGYYGYLW